MKLPEMKKNDDGTTMGYGFFGYPGAMCDLAISRDDPEMIDECIDRGFLAPACITLDGMTVRAKAREKGSLAVENHLKNRQHRRGRVSFCVHRWQSRGDIKT